LHFGPAFYWRFTGNLVILPGNLAIKHNKIRQAPKARKALKIQEKSATRTVADLVELRGIEPLSESISAELSPGAGGYGAVTRDSLSRGKPSRRSGQVAS